MSILKPSTKPMKRTRLNRRGPRVRAWETTRNRLKLEFLSRGIVRCEFGFEGCAGAGMLTFAHAVKRRNLEATAKLGAPEHIATVALACLRCHDRLDVRMTAEEMRAAVMEAIGRRGNL